MRAPKASDSPCGFDREAPHRSAVYDTVRHQEAQIRRLTNERHERRMQALMPSVAPAVEEFGTWVTL